MKAILVPHNHYVIQTWGERKYSSTYFKHQHHVYGSGSHFQTHRPHYSQKKLIQ